MRFTSSKTETEHTPESITEMVRQLTEEATGGADAGRSREEESGRSILPLALVVGTIVAVSYLRRKQSGRVSERAGQVADQAADRTEDVTERTAERIEEGGQAASDRMEQAADATDGDGNEDGE